MDRFWDLFNSFLGRKVLNLHKCLFVYIFCKFKKKIIQLFRPVWPKFCHNYQDFRTLTEVVVISKIKVYKILRLRIFTEQSSLFCLSFRKLTVTFASNATISGVNMITIFCHFWIQNNTDKSKLWNRNQEIKYSYSIFYESVLLVKHCHITELNNCGVLAKRKQFLTWEQIGIQLKYLYHYHEYVWPIGYPLAW